MVGNSLGTHLQSHVFVCQFQWRNLDSKCSAPCYQTPKGALLLVRLSSMKHFSDKAKQEIVDAVWTVTAGVLASAETAGQPLTVGVGGRFLWDGARSGKLAGDIEAAPEPEIKPAHFHTPSVTTNSTPRNSGK